MVPAILIASLLLVLLVVLLYRARPRVVRVKDGSEDGSGHAYECFVCGSRRVQVAEYRERCLACGYSSSETYPGTCGAHVELLRDVDGALARFEIAGLQLGGSDPNWDTYASELTQGIAQLSGGAPLVQSLLAIHEAELAEQVRQLAIEDSGYSTRAERYLNVLRSAREVLSKDIQRRLR